MPLRPQRFRRSILAALAASMFWLVSPADARAAEPVRLMPLGDSITEARAGTRGAPSYRKYLWDKLVANGYHGVDIVGSRTGVLGDATEDGTWDANHEGHWGWRTDEVLNGHPGQQAAGRLSDWVAAAQPDVVLVHLGTNDVLQGQSNASTIEELGLVIDTLRAGNPAIKVVVAAIIPSTKTDTSMAAIAELNSLVPGLVKSKHTSASPVVYVDQHTNYDPIWNYDQVHPKKRGQVSIANRFYSLLVRKGFVG